MTIYLIRHTTPDVDACKTLYGQTDLDLVDTFASEVEDIHHQTMNLQFNTIFYSPLKRCKTLATALQGDLKVNDSRLKEISYGDWEMKTFSELKSKLKDWSKVFDHVAAPNGESLLDVKTRLLSFWSEAIEYRDGDQIAIVTHGVVMRILLTHFLEMPLKNIFRIQFSFGKVIKLSMTESGQINLQL